MSTALKAGLAYFSIVFAIGFALGAVRTLVFAPRMGELRAVLLELPIVLTASWLVCRWVLKRWSVSDRASDRLIMGAIAFALLIAAETAVGVLAFGRSIAAHFASYGSTSARVGLAAQVLFALFPLLNSFAARSPSPFATLPNGSPNTGVARGNAAAKASRNAGNAAEPPVK